MTSDNLKIKIAQDTYYTRRIFESCITHEQLENTNSLACQLVSNWYNLIDKHIGIIESSKIWKYINKAANDMEKFHNEGKKRIAPNKQNYSKYMD